jgi:uncharacterized sulfatase
LYLFTQLKEIKYMAQSRNRWPSIVVLMSAMLLLISCNQHTRPNVLFIVADDMGAWTLGSSSWPNAHTPHLDRLADQGVLFKNAFSVSAFCSPARAALISSRYPSETGVMELVRESNPIGIDTALVLWPEVFARAGYQTALVGKWHLGEKWPHQFPEANGYQYFSGFLRGGMRSRDPIVRIEGRDTVFHGRYTPDVLTELAMDYIRDFQHEPWAISLHFWAPHANTDFPDGFMPTARGRSWLPMQEADLVPWKTRDLVLPDPDFPNLDVELTERMTREYHSSVHSVDRNVGRIMALLEQLDMVENTIVVLTSDHGYMMGHHGLWHKGNGRWLTLDEKDPTGKYPDGRPNVYDLSLRVPCIVSWPGTLPSGEEVERHISHLDLYPSLLDLAGIQKAEDLLLRGSSLVPLLQGEKIDWDNTVFAQYLHLRSIQTPEWKYVYSLEDTTMNELYHLVDDPVEYVNLLESEDQTWSNKHRELRSRLFSWMAKIGDPGLDE